MDAQTTPRETWQFWSAARHILGDAQIQKIFKVELRQLQRYSADPRYAESSQANPDDRYEVVLHRLIEAGRLDVARDRVARAAHIVGCDLRCLDPASPDKGSMAEECLDDLPALSEYHRLLNDAGSTEVDVRAAWQRAKQELDENYELFLRTRR
jgi:hypothetical protein